ncbi:hypothetical protein [Streptomyces sp. WMMC897]|uniref:hypothetical protein n=1 Tax=Streptomyces sp. WMMC897 TaxID=3014782 RepID=UPI0022B606A0|nr:hypothetical protein [Streptomyces sp. WMMC897]MCZ7413043.1 hypothetical protein [Streptomyces sp. WMMC897]MCZ7413075.1 hypothetical protein [Streptomyces sp. WMMC897]MCZ7415453.1 hypothetical protein [Streptomyces sp. WMMC897]
MRVRMRVAISGGRSGQPWPPVGGELDVPDAEGAKLCAAGLAQPVARKDVAETATPPESETRTPKAETPHEPPAAEQVPAKRGRGRPRKAPPAGE